MIQEAAGPADEIGRIIAEGRVRVVLQPVVDLRTAAVVGYEALSRGPAGTPLESPLCLFAAAEAADLLPPLDVLCMHRAVAAKRQLLGPGNAIFINVDPRAVLENDYRQSLLAALDQEGLPPGEVVLEITENRFTGDDAALHRALEPLHDVGIAIAVDDLGAGYAGLQSILSLQPRIIKLDRFLVHGIDRDSHRAALLEGIAFFARKVDARTVAEGIESAGELETLCRLEIDYGQGFFLGEPGQAPGGISRAARRIIHRVHG